MAVAEEKKRIQVTLPLEIWRDLDDYAKSRGVAKSSMAAIAIAEFFCLLYTSPSPRDA